MENLNNFALLHKVHCHGLPLHGTGRGKFKNSATQEAKEAQI